MKNCTWLGFLHPRFKRKKKKRQKPKAINLAYFLILTTSIRVGFFVLNSLTLFSLLFVRFMSFIPNVAVQKNAALGLRPPEQRLTFLLLPGNAPVGQREGVSALFPMLHFLFWRFGVSSRVPVPRAVHEHFIQPLEGLHQVVLEGCERRTDGRTPKTVGYQAEMSQTALDTRL